jgi:predicted transcriptional regulator
MVGTKCASREEKKSSVKRYLEEKRCATVRELALALEIDKTTLRGLLLQLEREGVVESRKIGRVVLWCIAKKP